MDNLFDDVKRNEEAYEKLRPDLERNHWDEWVIIVKGQVVTIAPTLQEAFERAGTLPPDVPSQLVRNVGEELPKVVWKVALDHGEIDKIFFMKTLSLCLDDDVDAGLEAVSAKLRRPKVDIVAEMIRKFVEVERLKTELQDPALIALYRELEAEDEALSEEGISEYQRLLAEADQSSPSQAI